MARKQKQPEHENSERWMISYSDFITLLFATFVVLYALSQTDIQDFKAMEESMKQAFSAPSVMHGSEGIMDNNSNSLSDSSSGSSIIAPLMLEYLSQRYEDDSMGEIQKEIENENKSGELDGVSATITDKGLLIRIKNECLFKSGSAKLTIDAQRKLDKIGIIIFKKFVLHKIRIEGHTDSQPINSTEFPSNWELSAIRATTLVRYFTNRFGFLPGLFIAVGMADTCPVADNYSYIGREKNRRVEILILKNKYGSQEKSQNIITSLSKEDQKKLQANRIEIINRIKSLPDNTLNITKGGKKAGSSSIILNKIYYNEMERISKQTQILDSTAKEKVTGEGNWLKPPGKAATIQ